MHSSLDLIIKLAFVPYSKLITIYVQFSWKINVSYEFIIVLFLNDIIIMVGWYGISLTSCMANTFFVINLKGEEQNLEQQQWNNKVPPPHFYPVCAQMSRFYHPSFQSAQTIRFYKVSPSPFPPVCAQGRRFHHLFL